MSTFDDPRGYRRDQAGGRDYAPARQGPGGRSSPPDDRYEGYRQAEPPASRPPQQGDKPLPSFSAYRPEAYADPETGQPARSERADWDDGARNAPRTPPPRDPYYQNGGADPYATPSQRGGYEPDWQQDSYPDADGQRFPNFYPAADEAPSGPDAQSVHDRFFSNDPQADNAPPPPQLSRRLQNAFEDHDFDDREPGFDRNAAPRRPDAGPYDTNFEDEQHYDWDKYDQAAAPPPASRQVYPPALRDEDMDADFFADEDDYDVDDYELEGGGGRKKLIAAVLAGAVAVGGGLAYVYKSTNNDSGGDPSVITADSTPIKEEPSDPGGREFPNGNKLIYERLPGYETASASVVTSQNPSESESASASGSSDPIPGIVTTGGTLEERIENALKAQGGDKSEGASAQGSPDKPRAIRTITYGPDGNPVELESKTQRIAAADATGNNASTGGAISSVSAGPSSDDSAGGQAASAQQPEPAEQAPAEAATPDAPTQVANVAPEQQAPQVTEVAGGTGAYFVQIGARNDRDAAIAAFATLQKKYASVIGSYSPAVRKADLGEKGVWYRLWVGPVEDEGGAKTLCEQLKGAGMPACLVRKDQ